MFLLHLLFLSCCLAVESVPDSEDSSPRVGDIMELPSEGKSASNSVNVEEILRELRECRQKNRNLNETIDNILEEMADMKEYIVRNEEKITQVQSSVALMSHDLDKVEDTVERNSAQITSVFEDVVSLTDDVVSLTISDQQQGFQIEALTEDVKSLNSTYDKQVIMIEDNIQRLDTLSTRGRWCGYQDGWSADNSIITYDSYFFTDTNMNVSVTPLDITTGIKLTNNCITHLLTFVSLQASSLCP